jgi:hypothetical protein
MEGLFPARVSSESSVSVAFNMSASTTREKVLRVLAQRAFMLYLSYCLRLITMWIVSTFRLHVVLAILLTLPVYGLAGLAQRSCQEQMRTSQQVVLAGDCCPGKTDQSTPCKRLGEGPLGKNGSCTACKAGYSCKSPQSYEPAHGPVLIVLSAQSTSSTELPPPLLSPSPEGLWRPPRLS